MTDVVTSKFRERIARGEWVVNPMTSRNRVVVISGDAPSVRSKTPTFGTTYGTWDYRGCYKALRMGLNNPDSVQVRLVDAHNTSRIVDEAATAVWAEASQMNANLLVGLAELRQTLSMLRRPLSKLVSLTNSAMRSHGKTLKGARGLKRFRDAAEASWMETRYGWRPAIAEVQGVLDAFQKDRSRKVHFHRKTVKKHFESVSHTTENWSNIALITWQERRTEDVTCRAFLAVEEAYDLTQRLGMSLSGALQLPWELIPASFVLDWVGNVGTYLSAIGAYATLHPQAAGYTMSKDIGYFLSAASTADTSIRSVIRSSSETVSIVWSEKDRLTSLPSPQLTIKADWAQMKDVKHVIDLAIILKSRLVR